MMDNELTIDPYALYGLLYHVDNLSVDNGVSVRHYYFIMDGENTLLKIKSYTASVLDIGFEFSIDGKFNIYLILRPLPDNLTKTSTTKDISEVVSYHFKERHIDVSEVEYILSLALLQAN